MYNATKLPLFSCRLFARHWGFALARLLSLSLHFSAT